MPNRFSTAALAIDPELAPGARNAIRDCLRLQPNERITIITDEATRDIATALQQQVEEVGSDYAVFVLEEYADRPLTKMPREILDDLATSQVSIFAPKPSVANSARAWR
jgi:leucyl aminopeptidase (aminopeptidase T)